MRFTLSASIAMIGVLSTSWVFSLFIDRNSPGDPIWLHVYWLLAAIAAVSLLPRAAPYSRTSAIISVHASARPCVRSSRVDRLAAALRLVQRVCDGGSARRGGSPGH